MIERAAAIPEAVDPYSLLGGTPFKVQHVGRADLTVYLSPKAEGESVLVVEEKVTGRVCVQQHSLMPGEVLPFACFDMKGAPVPDFKHANTIEYPLAGDVERGGSARRFFELVTLQRGTTLGAMIELQVEYNWNLKAGEVCANLIQRAPRGQLTEVGCRRMTFEERWKHVPKDRPSVMI